MSRKFNGGLSAVASQATLSMTVENMLVDLLGHLEGIGYGIKNDVFRLFKFVFRQNKPILTPFLSIETKYNSLSFKIASYVSY